MYVSVNVMKHNIMSLLLVLKVRMEISLPFAGLLQLQIVNKGVKIRKEAP